MGKRQERVPPYSGSPIGNVDKVYVWPCGCVTHGARDGELIGDCGDEGCYRRTAPPVRRVGAAPKRPFRL